MTARGARSLALALTVALTLLGVMTIVSPAQAVVGVPVTYAGHTYATSVAKPSSDKPQSKLWHHDGAWWAIMVSAGDTIVTVHELMSDHTWRNTGTIVDSRVNGTGDVLWSAAEAKLYVATRATGSNLQVNRLSYSSVGRSWSVDTGFPVTVNTGGGSESATIDRDSLGRLWVTYTRLSRLWVAHSDPGGLNWTAGFQPNVPDVVIKSDDISALIAFGSSIGVLWSDQQSSAMRFAIHEDADPDTVWRVEDALAGSLQADDHINLKQLAGDPQGRIFAAIKTSQTASTAILTGVLVRTPGAGGGGTWTLVPAGTVADNHTRPIIAIDQSNQELYFFATASGGDIYYKRTPLANPSFGPGRGAKFVDHSSAVSDATASKDSVTAQTGLVVLSTADAQKRYVHAEMELNGAPPPPPDTTPPTVPTNLTATPSLGQVALSWTGSADNVGVTGYTIRRDGVEIITTGGTTYIDGGLTPGTYSYTVQAVDAAGNRSAESAPVSATVPDNPPPGSGIALRGSSTAANAITGASTLVVPAPTNTAGDVMVASIDLRGAMTITPPVGWQLIRTDVNGTALRKSTFWRVAGSAEPASYTWQFSSPTTRATGSVLSYTGVSAADPIEASSGQVNPSSTSITAASLTTTSPNALVVGLFSVARTATVGPPTGMTERTEVTSPAGSTYFVTAATADVAQSAPGATGAKIALSSLAAVNIGHLVALRPAV